MTEIDHPVAAARDRDRDLRHVYRLDDRWFGWRWTSLRTAGLPLGGVLCLATPELRGLADAVTEAGEQAREAATACLSALRHDHESASGTCRQALSRALRQLRKGKDADLTCAAAETRQHLVRYREYGVQHEQRLRSFRAAFDAAQLHLREVFGQQVSTPLYRAAIAWQNADGFAHARQDSLDRAGTAGSKARAGERLLLTYLQRYCTKNETIGFFGPQAWARIVDQPERMLLTHGPSLVRTSHVSFESWAIDLLAERLAENPALEPWLTPRRVPTVSVSAAGARLPSGEELPLDSLQRVVLSAADGAKIAEALVRELHRSAAASESAAYEALRELRERGLITWRFELPLSVSPEESLGRQLGAVTAGDVRDEALAVLERLERARRELAEAVTPEAVTGSLAGVRRVFAAAVGDRLADGTQRENARKGLVYEDCVRDVDVSLGEQLFRDIAVPLQHVLSSARWLTATIADAYMGKCDALHRELGGGACTVPAADFWAAVRPVLFDDDRETVASAVAELQRRWSTVLPPASGNQVRVSAQSIAESVRQAFPPTPARWAQAQYVSVDLLIAASEVAVIAEGKATPVLGEVHLGNALHTGTFVDCHPDPGELQETIAADLPTGRVILPPPRNWPHVSFRMGTRLSAPQDVHVLIGAHVHGAFGERCLPIADCVVQRCGDRLHLRSLDGRYAFDLVEVLGSAFNVLVFNEFHPFHSREAHSPRLTIDSLVVARETWRFRLDALAELLAEEDPALRFIAIRRWQRAHGIPRWCFFRVPDERKPIYIDFDSPLLLDLFAARTARSRARNDADAMVVISEMLPTPGQAWVVDTCGERYTSEFRMVLLDRGSNLQTPQA